MHSKAQASKRRKQPDAAGGANLRRNEVGACVLVLQSHGPHGSLRYMVKVSVAGNAVCCKCHVYDVSSLPLRVRTRQRIRRHLSIFTATSCLCVTMPWGNTSIVTE